MYTIQKTLTNPGTSLVGYIHDKSTEMRSADIRPAMLVFPGGGYSFCSDREADPVALAYAAAGFNAFILRYTVGQDEPCSKSFDDAEEALKYLHSNADELHIDKNKIAVVGFSAGGHLAAWLSVHGKIRPNAAILGYPCIFKETGSLLNKEFPELCETTHDKTPPTFIFTTRTDELVIVEHSLAYASAIAKNNIAFELHIFGDGGHGLSMATAETANGNPDLVNPDFAKWFGLSVSWLKKTLGDFPTN